MTVIQTRKDLFLNLKLIMVQRTQTENAIINVIMAKHLSEIHHQVYVLTQEDKSEKSMIFTNLNVLLILTNYIYLTSITDI